MDRDIAGRRSVEAMRASAPIRMALAFVAAAALLYLAICLLVFVLQRSLLYFPQPSSLAGRDTTVVLPGVDARVAASVRERGAEQAVLYFGGNGEDVTRSIPDLQAAFPTDSLYLLHYRGYGESGGKPSEAALLSDALALYDLAQARHRNIQVIGRSLGSGLAVRVASVRPVARLVLVTPYDSLQEIATARFPFLPVAWLLLDKYDSWRYAPQVTAPTLLIAAGNDEVIPRASTERLLSRFRPGVATLTVIEGAGHNSLSDRGGYAMLLAGDGRRALPVQGQH